MTRLVRRCPDCVSGTRVRRPGIRPERAELRLRQGVERRRADDLQGSRARQGGPRDGGGLCGARRQAEWRRQGEPREGAGALARRSQPRLRRRHRRHRALPEETLRRAHRRICGRRPRASIPSSASSRCPRTPSSARSPIPTTSAIRSSRARRADFAAVNARFANAAKKAVADATPQADSGLDREQGWTYEQGFKLYRPSANAVTVAVDFYGYSGGAHGYRRHRLHPGRSAHGQDRGPGRRVRGGRQMAEDHGRDRRRRSQEAVRRQARLRRSAGAAPASPSSCASPAIIAGMPTGWR